MNIILWIIAVLGILFGSLAWVGSKGAIHEIEAFISFLIAIISMVGASGLSKLDTIAGLLQAANEVTNDRHQADAPVNTTHEAQGSKIEKPADISIGEWQEKVMADNHIRREGAGYAWNGKSFPSFNLVVEAINSGR